MEREKQQKVEKFEKFVNEKLKNDLALVLAEQDRIYSEIAEYLQVKDTIEKLNSLKTTPDSTPDSTSTSTSSSFKTRVDLGCNFYANAVVENQSRIFLAIGYGFFLDMHFDQALKFIEKKVKMLNESALELAEKASEIKANIKFVLEGLKEIQNLKFDDSKTNNSLFL